MIARKGAKALIMQVLKIMNALASNSFLDVLFVAGLDGDRNQACRTRA